MIRTRALKGKKRLNKAKLNNKNIIYRSRDNDLEFKMENEVGNNIIPKLMVEKFHFNADSKIYFRKPTQKRQGSAEHIIADHRKEVNQHYIMSMRNAILNPLDIVEMKRNRLALVSFYLKDKQNRTVFFYVIIEKDSNDFQIVTAFPTRKHNRKNKKR